MINNDNNHLPHVAAEQTHSGARLPLLFWAALFLITVNLCLFAVLELVTPTEETVVVPAARQLAVFEDESVAGDKPSAFGRVVGAAMVAPARPTVRAAIVPAALFTR